MLDRRQYAVKEHVGMFKLHDHYDIFDAETQQKLGVAIEDVGLMRQLLRLVVNKQMLPTTIHLYAGEGEGAPVVLTLHRGFSFFRSRVDVLDGAGNSLGYFKSKLLTIGGGFYVYDTSDKQVADVKGDWKSWNFRFLGGDGTELGIVSRKWGGMMKEFFTSADSYHIQIADSVPTHGGLVALLLAAGLAIDIVYKETSE